MGNPNHDPKTGEFADGPGGSMGSAAHASGASTGDKTSDHAVNGKIDPAIMTGGQINKSLDKLSLESSKINDKFISSGRGQEKPSEILTKSDSLSLAYRLNNEKMNALRNEMERRYGPGVPNRLPHSFLRSRGLK